MLYGLFNKALDWERSKYFIRLTLSVLCFRFWGEAGLAIMFNWSPFPLVIIGVLIAGKTKCLGFKIYCKVRALLFVLFSSMYSNRLSFLCFAGEYNVLIENDTK